MTASSYRHCMSCEAFPRDAGVATPRDLFQKGTDLSVCAAQGLGFQHSHSVTSSGLSRHVGPAAVS